MPETRRKRRPVVEEIVETPEPRVAPHVEHHQSQEKPQDVKPSEPYVQTVQEVASYDEPAAVSEKKPDVVAREFLSGMDGNERREKKPNVKFIFVVTILTALIVGFIAGGVYVYVSGVNGSGDTVIKPTVTPTAMPEDTSTPTPKPPVKLDTLSVNVLNGSGIIGAASKVKDSLTSGGFTVSGTGNAANYNFQKTTIQVKSTVSADVVDALKTALKDYSVTVGDNLPDSSKYDIVVTAGKQ